MGRDGRWSGLSEDAGGGGERWHRAERMADAPLPGSLHNEACDLQYAPTLSLCVVRGSQVDDGEWPWY